MTVDPLQSVTLNRFKAILCTSTVHSLIFTQFVILASPVVDMLEIRKAKVRGYRSGKTSYQIVTKGCRALG